MGSQRALFIPIAKDVYLLGHLKRKRLLNGPIAGIVGPPAWPWAFLRREPGMECAHLHWMDERYNFFFLYRMAEQFSEALA